MAGGPEGRDYRRRGATGHPALRHPATLLSLLSLLSAASCSDPGSPGASLDSPSRDVIASILARQDPTELGLGPYAKLLATTFDAAGAVPAGASTQSAGPGAPASAAPVRTTARQMSAVALILEYDVVGSDSQRYRGALTEILGWSGLDETKRTVADMFAAGAWSDDSAHIGSGSYEMSSLNDPDGFAYYAKPPGNLLSLAIGSFQVTGQSFTGATVSCGTVARATCEYTTGTLDATFSFRVEDAASADVYVQPKTAVTGLPAVRVRLTSK